MTTIIVRNLDEQLAASLKKEAQRRSMSVNKLVHRFIEQGVRPQSSKASINDLAKFSGRWSKAEQKEFQEATKAFEQIDAELWQ